MHMRVCLLVAIFVGHISQGVCVGGWVGGAFFMERKEGGVWSELIRE